MRRSSFSTLLLIMSHSLLSLMKYGPAFRVCCMALFRSSSLLLRTVLGDTMAVPICGAPNPQSLALGLIVGLVPRVCSIGWCFHPQSIAHGLIVGSVPQVCALTWTCVLTYIGSSHLRWYCLLFWASFLVRFFDWALPTWGHIWVILFSRWTVTTC